jgi:hypothetical protein
MKNLAALFALLLACIPPSFARAKNVLKVRADNDMPITVSINGRYYDKVARELTIGDLPAGRHQINIYEFKAYRDEQGGKAKLLFSGSVRVKRNTITTCTVNPAGGEIYVQSTEIGITEDGNEVHEMPGNIGNGDITRLKPQVQAKQTDTEKLKLMQSSLENASYTTTQVGIMMGWLSFDDSRLEFAKWAYGRTTDKAQYSSLEKEFSLDASKDEFLNFLKSN